MQAWAGEEDDDGAEYIEQVRNRLLKISRRGVGPVSRGDDRPNTAVKSRLHFADRFNNLRLEPEGGRQRPKTAEVLDSL
jgi:hypothetical protein